MSERLKVLLTGATGFIGAGIVRELCQSPRYNVTAAVRRKDSVPGHATVVVGDIGGGTDWSEALRHQKVVIHLAGQSAVSGKARAFDLENLREVNVAGTVNLARQAAGSGVRRFIFISSVKIHGEQTLPGRPFNADSAPRPEDEYAASKLEAEKALRAVALESGMELVIIRPPMVYGPGGGGNFALLATAVHRKWPLPFGAVKNRRALVALDNLVDLVIKCIDHPNAVNRAFLVSDGEDLSTPELLRRMAAALDTPSLVMSFPPGLLALAAMCLGKKRLVQRLTGSLEVDISETRNLLNWKPPLSVDEGLSRCLVRSREK
ncbi:NAD-dependent epimerase/dehydratase family protein [Marinobacter sp.]|uniref:NAD-dependent epimerase/dehydratase family protein n=1 Tax=Marinobacter sp. TaxID=50741 RepID=UPI0035629D0E